MCLAIPAQIVEISGTRAQVALGGNVWEADITLVEDVALSTWVLVHAGFAIEKISQEDAQEILGLLGVLEEDSGVGTQS